MSDRPPFRMLLDFDGTLVEPNVAIILVEEFCTDGKRLAHEVDELLHTGKITLREAWARQVALLDGRRLDEMAAWAVQHSPLRPGAKELVALLGKHHIPTTVVSGGLDFYIEPVLKAASIDLPVLSDRVRPHPDGHLDLEHPYGHVTCRLCGICKAQIARPMPFPPMRTAFAGDGSTDKYAAEVADIVFARRRLRQYCERSGVAHVPFGDDFFPVIETLEGWLERGVPLPPPRAAGVLGSDCPISRACAAA